MLSTILQAIGVAAVTVGLGLIYVPAGVIAGGVGVLLFGLALERSGK